MIRFRHTMCAAVCSVILSATIATAQQHPAQAAGPKEYTGTAPLAMPSTIGIQNTTQGLDATVVATQDYLKTGQARTVRAGDFLAFPYGRSQPTLTCAPLRTCLIRLQAGETVLGPPALGDSERWITGLMVAGAGGTTPLIYVKPTECDITTNVVIATDRHLYTVMLDAPPCRATSTNSPREPYIAHLTFYYPDELAQQWAPQTTMRTKDIVFSPTPTGAAPEELHFSYDVKKDRHFPWSPEHVFDDGAHLYVKRPAGATNTAAPILFGIEPNGGRAILNYTLKRDYYITDRVLDRVVFVINDGGTERRLTLTRTGGT